MADSGNKSVRGPQARHASPIDLGLGKVRWLSVEQIRKQQRMRRQTVVEAMLCGQLPYEQRGRIRYARVQDVEAWEQSRLVNNQPSKTNLHPALAGLS